MVSACIIWILVVEYILIPSRVQLENQAIEHGYGKIIIRDGNRKEITMPHDKNGRLIELGDTIKVPAMGFNNRVFVGPVVSINASQKCTGQMLCAVVGMFEKSYFNADEAEIILKHNGSEPNDGPPSTVEPSKGSVAGS